jgi:hypothetical protein
MSFRDTLSEAERPAFDQAADALMADYSAAWADLFESVRVHGLDKAAERCVFPGRDVQKIQRRLQEIQDAARQESRLRNK